MFRSQRLFFPAYAVSVVQGGMVAATATAIALLAFVGARPAAAQATIEYGHVASGSSAAVAGLGSKVNSSLSPDKTSASAPASRKGAAGAIGAEDGRDESSVEEANRRALERSAGQDAAKLNFKSVPANAVVRIDGKPVGLTPLLMSLAPGTYQVEMEGPRMEFGKQRLTLGAKETRDIELRLAAAPRYPTHITLQ
ncbi:MAG: PEGA domain-containing protein [Terriglobales bacterium]